MLLPTVSWFRSVRLETLCELANEAGLIDLDEEGLKEKVAPVSLLQLGTLSPLTAADWVH